MMIALILFANFMVMMFGGLEALRAYTSKLLYSVGDQAAKHHGTMSPGFRWLNAVVAPIGVCFTVLLLLICVLCLFILLCQWINEKSDEISERMSNL